ncbi:MAG: TRAP transporter substrate-binding protein [bacterium]|nr:TRAP transporter substrate-binding protein [bacterium]
MHSKYNRAGFLKGLGKAAAGAAVLGSAGLAGCKPKGEGATAANGGKTYKWKMVTTWPKNFPGLGTGANRLAEVLESMSGGRIQVKVFAAGELVPPFEVFDAVAGGTADIGHGAAYYWKGKSEAAQFFAAVPFGLNAQEMSGWINYGGGQQLWDELYAGFNLKAFACGNTGVQMGGWFNREIKSIKDYNGLKIRMPGLGGEVLRKAGATVVSLPGGEIFQALQSGAIDATEWVGPYNDLAFGFYKAAKYYYWPGWHEPGTAMELLINRKLYEELPQDLQAIVETACRAAYTEMLAEFTARNNAALVELVKKHKVQLKRFPDAVLKTMGEYSQEVVAGIAAKDAMSKKIYDSFLKFRGQAVEWNQIGEEGFSLARSLTA